MKKSCIRFIHIIVTAFIFCSIFNITTYATGSSSAIIMGDVKLPNSLKSTESIEITIELNNLYDDTAKQSTTAIINEGSNSASYYFDSIPLEDGYYIQYSLTNSSSYFPFGYYNSSGTTYNENYYENIDLSYSNFFIGDLTLISIPNLANNQSYVGSLSSADDVNYFKFCPDSTQNYICESSGNLDTYGAILDSDMNEVVGASNDDINIEKWWLNFRIFTELEAGKTYYIKVKCNSVLGYGDFGISISKSDASSLDTNLVVRSTKLLDSQNNAVTSLTSGGTAISTVKVTNISDLEQNGALFVVLYNGNKVENIQVKINKVAPGDTVDFITSYKLPNIVAGKTLRVIFWNDLNGITPYSRIISNIN